MEMTWELCCKTRCCVRVIWSSEPSGPCKGMGVSHDLEGLRCCGDRSWPRGCSADCNVLGLMGDPGVVLTVFSGFGM